LSGNSLSKNDTYGEVSMNKVVVLGSGYLGHEFEKLHYTVLDKERFNLSQIQINDSLEFPFYMARKLDKFDVVINCIAKSNTRYCEENYNEAFFSNAVIPQVLSQWCNGGNKKFVQISTGCLYDRNDTPQKETDFLSAHCNYTLTKWHGEKGCDFDRDLIIRPRLFFDFSARENNLLNKIKRFDKLCDEKDSVTNVTILTKAIKILIDNECTGAYNVACDGYVSMHEIGLLMGMKKEIISIEEIRRQQGLHLVNSIMDLSKLKKYYTPPNIIELIRSQT
jgi:dTDP-4-dehydrorhamnose reductase